MKVRGCLAYWQDSGNIYLVPLSGTQPVAISERIPTENNALTVRTRFKPMVLLDTVDQLKFSPTGDCLLFLAHRFAEAEEVALRRGISPQLVLGTRMGAELYLADLRRRFICRLDLGLAFKEQDYTTISWTAQEQVLATRGGKLLLIDLQAWRRNPNHIAQRNKDFWVLTDDALCHVLTPDQRNAYFLNRRGTRFGGVSCDRNAKVRWLPPIPKGHGEIREELIFPTGTGLMFATITRKEIDRYEKTLWAWQRGHSSYRQVSRVPSEVDVVTYLHERNAFLLSDKLTKYAAGIGIAPRFKNLSWFRLGLCSARSGTVQWFRIDHPKEAVPAIRLELLQARGQGSVLVVQGSNFHPDKEKRQEWAWIGLLDVGTMGAEWVRRLDYGVVWAWSPRCDWLTVDARR